MPSLFGLLKFNLFLHTALKRGQSLFFFELQGAVKLYTVMNLGGHAMGDNVAFLGQQRPAPWQSKGPVFLRIQRNIFQHMTLQQNPKDFDVLVQQYELCGLDQGAKDADADHEEVVPWGDYQICNLKDAQFLELMQFTSLCTMEDINITPIDNSDAGLLLLQMAESRAWGSNVSRVSSSNCTAFYIPHNISDNDSAFAKLKEDGLITESKSKPEHYYITMKGSRKLNMKIAIGNKQSLEEYQKLLGSAVI